ncbi:MAG: hypothetical protein V2J07_02190 [Anaerolineae bacterium]|jgi:hypothetical protein|nr:hypothetical protein [Anaerolineae bacterium]
MSAILGVIIMALGLMLQTAVFSRTPLLFGTVDVILLLLISWALQPNLKDWEVWFWAVFGSVFVGFISVVPAIPIIATYLAVIFVIRWMQKKIWKASVLVLFFGTALATVFQQTVIFGILRFLNGVPLTISDSFTLVIIPSMVLNLMFAFPVYLLIKDLADWLSPEDLDY